MKFSTYSIDDANLILDMDESEVSKLHVSDPIVMASAAGWYVGRICRDTDCPEIVQPYDRMTDYMTELQAIEWLNQDRRENDYG